MNPDIRAAIKEFLATGPFAVVGASRDRHKFGNRLLRHYRAHGQPVVGVHPRETEIEGIPCFPNLAAVPDRPRAISIVTPPAVTEQIVHEAVALDIRWLWMQPGAESVAAVAVAEQSGAVVIHGGACVLVELR